MANEITEPGQIVQYGGPTLTLLNSPLAGLVKSILAREGSGTARAWKLFDPAKADFLNTKKTLSDGDYVLVNAKALPMDFPIKVATTTSPDYLLLDVYAGGATQSTSFYLNSSGVTYGAPVFIDATGAVVAATAQFLLDNGTPTDNAGFNAALAALSEAELLSGNHSFTIRCTVPSGVAGTFSIPLT